MSKSLFILRKITSLPTLIGKTFYNQSIQSYLLQINNYCTSSCDDDDDKASKSFRHSYHTEVENGVNSQILGEMNASFIYLSLSVYYGRTDIAMPGCQIFFEHLYKEEQEHALKFINYQLLRGGIVKLFPIAVPEKHDWIDITVSLGVALELEKQVKEKLESLFCVAEKYNDKQLMDILSSDFITEQNTAIWELGRLLTRAKRLVESGNGVGRHLFDKELFDYAKSRYGIAQKFYI